MRDPGFELSVSSAEAERVAYFPAGLPVPPPIQRNLEALPVPDTRPAYTDLLVEITGDRLVGVASDSLDVERVQVLPVRCQGPGAAGTSR